MLLRIVGEEYTDELCTKDLHDPVKHNGVITQLEPDVLECEVKQYFRNITTNKALGGDGIQLSSFNSKRLCCECAALHRPANLGNAAVARGLEEVSFHFNHNKRQSKEWANYRLTAIISHSLKALLKIPKATLQHNVNHKLTDAQGGFKKDKKMEIKLPTSVGSSKREENARKACTPI